MPVTDDIEFIIRARHVAQQAFSETQQAIRDTGGLAVRTNEEVATSAARAGQAMSTHFGTGAREGMAKVRAESRHGLELLTRDFGIELPRAMRTAILEKLPGIGEMAGKMFGVAAAGFAGAMIIEGAFKAFEKVQEIFRNMAEGDTFRAAYLGISAQARQAALLAQNRAMAGVLATGEDVALRRQVIGRGGMLVGGLRLSPERSAELVAFSRHLGEGLAPGYSPAVQQMLDVQRQQKIDDLVAEQRAENQREAERSAQEAERHRRELQNTLRAFTGLRSAALAKSLTAQFLEFMPAEKRTGIFVAPLPQSLFTPAQILEAAPDFATMAISPFSGQTMNVRNLASLSTGLGPLQQALDAPVNKFNEGAAIFFAGVAQFRAEVRRMGEGLFESLFRGRTGVLDFIKGTFRDMGRTILGNVFEVLLGGAHIPHAGADAQGRPASIWGRILHGTIFGPRASDIQVTQQNTDATKDNTDALNRLNDTLGGHSLGQTGSIVGAGTHGGWIDVLGKLAAIIPPMTGSSANMMTFHGFPAGGGEGIGNIQSTIAGVMSRLSGTLARVPVIGPYILPVLGAAAGIAGLIASGSAMHHIASGIMAGAAIGSIIPGVGTLIGGAIGGGIGLIRSLFGGHPSPEQRALEIERLLTRNRYIAPLALTRAYAYGGGFADEGFGGVARAGDLAGGLPYGWQNQLAYTNITRDINDNPVPYYRYTDRAGATQWLLDNSAAVASAVRKELTSGTHPLNLALREAF